MVRDNIDWLDEATASPQPEDVRELYELLWGTQPKIQLPVFGEEGEGASLPLHIDDVLSPITVKEIAKRIAKTNPKTAKGPDGLTRRHLSHWVHHELLHLLFNYLVVCGKQPTQWRSNRTTLILKEGKDAAEASSYRPITISSILSRLYWGLIDQKLRRVVVFTPRQKGFTNESGCYNNVHILNELLRHSKRKLGMVAVVLDVSKPFDTIPHQAIGAALRRKGFPEYVIRLVENSYKDVDTTISCADNSTIRITLQRGVKQGDPLSPFLSNAVLEPLLLALEQQPGYSIRGETTVSSLAFADDLILVASTESQARKLLSYTEGYLERLGKTMSATKCATFRIKTSRDSWMI